MARTLVAALCALAVFLSIASYGIFVNWLSRGPSFATSQFRLEQPTLTEDPENRDIARALEFDAVCFRGQLRNKLETLRTCAYDFFNTCACDSDKQGNISQKAKVIFLVLKDADQSTAQDILKQFSLLGEAMLIQYSDEDILPLNQSGSVGRQALPAQLCTSAIKRYEQERGISVVRIILTRFDSEYGSLLSSCLPNGAELEPNTIYTNPAFLGWDKSSIAGSRPLIGFNDWFIVARRDVFFQMFELVIPKYVYWEPTAPLTVDACAWMDPAQAWYWNFECYLKVRSVTVDPPICWSPTIQFKNSAIMQGGSAPKHYCGCRPLAWPLKATDTPRQKWPEGN